MVFLIYYLFFFQLSSSPEFAFMCGTAGQGSYEEGSIIGLFNDAAHPSFGDQRKFVINKDGTVSPMKAPGLVLGMQATELQQDAMLEKD